MARLRLIRRLVHRFGQIDKPRRALVAEAVAALLLARLALIFIAFPRLARRLGTFVPPTDARARRAETITTPKQALLAADIAWAVTRAARYVPFSAVCLPQAIAAHVMLKCRGIQSVMHFGAAKGEKKVLDAHAWLSAAGVEVTGYPVAKNFVEIACLSRVGCGTALATRRSLPD
jgi:Transglutaminase-like superfamily